MALTISVGFVVDDAIVVIENIVRHVEQGLTPLEATLRGARQIGFTVVSITISLVAVFIPLLFMGGIIGRQFHEFGDPECSDPRFSSRIVNFDSDALSRWLRRKSQNKLKVGSTAPPKRYITACSGSIQDHCVGYCGFFPYVARYGSNNLSYGLAVQRHTKKDSSLDETLAWSLV